MSVVRPAHGIATAATGAIAFTAGIKVVGAVMLWTSVDEATIAAIDWMTVLLQVVAGVLFMVWMGRARQNSDVITSRHQHRYTNMWVYLGWFIPVGNLFIPFAVMQDIWRGSDRSQPMVGLQKRPLSGLVTAWWIIYIGSNALALVSGMSAVQDAPAVYTLSAAGSAAAAVLAARVIKRVNEMQEAVHVQAEA